jgi:hypothetical protein
VGALYYNSALGAAPIYVANASLCAWPLLVNVHIPSVFLTLFNSAEILLKYLKISCTYSGRLLGALICTKRRCLLYLPPVRDFLMTSNMSPNSSSRFLRVLTFSVRSFIVNLKEKM